MVARRDGRGRKQLPRQAEQLAFRQLQFIFVGLADKTWASLEPAAEAKQIKLAFALMANQNGLASRSQSLDTASGCRLPANWLPP